MIFNILAEFEKRYKKLEGSPEDKVRHTEELCKDIASNLKLDEETVMDYVYLNRYEIPEDSEND